MTPEVSEKRRFSLLQIWHGKQGLFVLFLLAVALLVSYGRVLHAPVFVADEGSILRLPLLSWWRNLPRVFSRDFLMFTDGQFRPLSYALLASVRTFVAPDNVVFWHLWLLFFHLLNAMLVLLLVRHFSRHSGSALLASLIFALHPLATVVVNNINHFHYLLGLTFYLGALCCYLSFVRRSLNRMYVWAIVLFALGIFTSKIIFTLPVVIVFYEVFHCRSRPQRLLLRILPFVIISAGFSPLWLFYKPHPYRFSYIDLSVKVARNSFFSAVGATGWYLRGLLFGGGVPAVLREAVERILRFPHWRFLVWGAVDVGAIVAGGWILRRRRWWGLGLLFVFAALLPFVSSAWNRVEDYIHWSYLYIPTVGLALFVGGLADDLWSSEKRGAKRAVLAAFSLLVVFYGFQQVRVNHSSRSAASYWSRVLRLNPGSETASRELGKSYLKKGETAEAMGFLFSPAIRHIQPSSLVMSRHYCEQGEFLAAAIHLLMSREEEKGLRYQSSEVETAKLFSAAGAFDYAESALGKTLMANPYNIAAMDELARIWLLKGHVAAAGRLTDEMLKLDPTYGRKGRMLAVLEERRNAGLSFSLQVMEPPSPEWLKYTVEGARNARLREAMTGLGERLENDPVVQMEAGICLAKEGKPEQALSKLVFASQRLASFAYAWAMKCWVAVEAGDYRIAEEASWRALQLDPQNPTVHGVRALLLSREATDPQAPDREEKLAQAIGHYQQAVQLDPNSSQACNNLGNLLRRSGRLEEATEYYRQALRLKPDFAEAHNNLGAALFQQGKLEEAVSHCRRALQLKPGIAEFYSNLGAALAQQGKAEEAGACFEQALFIEPENTETFYNLVMLLTSQRQFARLVPLLQRRLKQVPGDIGSALNLAWMLATCPEPRLRNGRQAVELAERVCSATEYCDPRALDTLAAAYAEIGRFDEAIPKAQLALEIALSSGQVELGRRIQAHLKLYKNQKPVR